MRLNQILFLLASATIVNGRNLSVVVEGWIDIPHSFALVNVFQLVSLMKLFDDSIKIYYRSIPYFRDHWMPMQLEFMLPEKYIGFIRHMKRWQGEPVDAVYRIGYPTDLSSSQVEMLQSVPTFVFFVTNGIIRADDFLGCDHPDDNSSCVSGMLNDPANRKVQLVVPSPTSFRITKSFLHEVDLSNRLSLVTHGVDLEVYHHIPMTESHRAAVRAEFDLAPNDIVFLNVGAMVASKGITVMLQTMIEMSREPVFSNVKLLLKGLTSLYDSENHIMHLVDTLISSNFTTQGEVDRMIEKHVRFFGDTVSMDYLNVIYNIADAYLSPYIVEGFNLPVLEAIAVGLPVFVSENGSTSFYVNEILRQVPGADQHIFLLDPKTYPNVTIGDTFEYVSDFVYVYFCLLRNYNYLLTRPYSKYYYHAVRAFIEKAFTWDVAAEQLVRLFQVSATAT